MLGLHGAVEDMLRHYNTNPATCHFEVESSGDFSQLESALAISAYRIIQEALSNVVKHAQAAHAYVSLTLDQENNLLQIEISDDGVGYTVADGDPQTLASAGIGITGMRERVYAFKGTIHVETAPNAGTRIAIELPLARRAVASA